MVFGKCLSLQVFLDKQHNIKKSNHREHSYVDTLLYDGLEMN